MRDSRWGTVDAGSESAAS